MEHLNNWNDILNAWPSVVKLGGSSIGLLRIGPLCMTAVIWMAVVMI